MPPPFCLTSRCPSPSFLCGPFGSPPGFWLPTAQCLSRQHLSLARCLLGLGWRGVKTGGRNILNLRPLPRPPTAHLPTQTLSSAPDHEKGINQNLEEEVVSMAAARGWGGEARRGGGGRVGREGQKGRTGEGQAAGLRVRKMGWAEQEGR